MNAKERFKMVIKEFHESPLPDLLEREAMSGLPVLDPGLKKAISIIGPRRAGKTYFLFQLIKRLLDDGVPLAHVLYVNFEDERIVPLRPEDMQTMMDAYFELYPATEKPYLFLDEIQNVPEWDRFVRRMIDRGLRVFITGSNSRFLGREIATSLRGRTLTWEVFPFSFKEFLLAKGVPVKPDLPYSKNRHNVARLFEQYFISGGYPEIVLLRDETLRGRILQDYFNTVFYRDLVDRYAIKNTDLLKHWLSLLTANLSSLVSFSKVENDFKSRGMRLSRATLSYFSRYVEDTFFGFFLEMYSESARKRQVNPKKFYLIDVGIHNYLTFKFAENRGRLLENIVFLELRRRTPSIFYYRTGSGLEVDFLAKADRGWELVQVCHDIGQVEAFAREKKALVAAAQELGIKSGTLVTQAERREERTGECRLEILPAWEWLLRG